MRFVDNCIHHLSRTRGLAQQALRVLLGLGCCLRPTRTWLKSCAAVSQTVFDKPPNKTPALWSTSCVLSKMK
jgi:hypothetical protein